MTERMHHWTWEKSPENISTYERGVEAGRDPDCCAGDCPRRHGSPMRMVWIDGFGDGRTDRAAANRV